jgi:hypothetical protein
VALCLSVDPHLRASASAIHRTAGSVDEAEPHSSRLPEGARSAPRDVVQRGPGRTKTRRSRTAGPV